MSQTGIAYAFSPNGTPETIYLPLEELRVKVHIVDVSAKVTLSQIYSNPLDMMTTRCKYMFPVPASAAICAFRMTTSNGRTVTGVAKEKDTAQEEYEAALRQGNFTGLVNYVTDDIFTISVGAIPAHATVEVHLEYVMSLSNDDNADEIRFQLSRGIGERYGTPPPEMTAASRPAAHTRIRITCEIQTSGRIQNIVSPSHKDAISETRYPTHGGQESRRRTTVKFRSTSFLDRDFVLIIRAEGLDAPRCFGELQPDSGLGGTTIAMQLTLVPKFCLPPIASQEYLFVIDRSSSMGGARIMTAKDTLSLLLRMIPTQGSLFNVFIFDHTVSGLWQRSVGYGEISLKEATAYVDTIEVDHGTEIGNALRYVLGSRSQEMPTAIFLLTDGEAHGDEAKLVVEDAVKRSAAHAPLRVFTLGIGSGVSTATCDGIARAGNGVALYAIDAESILGKCARLFTAGRTPFVRNVTVDWGLSSEHLRTPTVNFLSQTLSSRTVAITPPPVIQQVPTRIQDVHAGTRMNIYVIITLKRNRVPKEVVLRGELDGGGGPFELTVPIRGVQLAGTDQGLPLIHTIAAWGLIQDHEERRAPLPSAILPASDEDIRKAVIVRLGEKYQLVSRHTSFVAVDAGQDDTQRVYRRRARQSNRSPTRQTADDEAQGSLASALFQSYLGFLSQFFGSGLSTTVPESQTVPGSWLDSPPPTPTRSRDDTDDDEDAASDGSAESDDTFSTLSSLESCELCDWSEPSSPELGPLSEEEEQRQGQPSPRIEPLNLAPAEDRRRGTRMQNALPVRSPAAPPAPPEVVQLVRLQSFDGSFQLDESLRRIVGQSAMNEVNNWNVDDKVWATVLSVAFIKKRMAQQKDLLNDLLAKALEYLDATAGADAEELIRRAAELIG
ncbi:putative vault protein inter-alpha-trypsin domain [Lyophyllum shimeji]|uniref:Vault protein inter-alpha-trypsin domain n=1 Tax=Lyophyllum shimeji TaxID=47721 RepID=A0A9P3PI23_LYOSH|nr:putative vault protein inter-alpha-trypsin domain [Lyophyllum shimeji]